MVSVSDFADPFFTKTKTLQMEREDGCDGGWLTYEAYIGAVGKVIGDESIKTKMVETRMSKRLRPDHNIPWPFCLEVENVDEKFAKKRKHMDAQVIGGEAEISGEQMQGMEQLFDATATSIASMSVAGTENLAIQDGPREVAKPIVPVIEYELKEKWKKAMTNGVKAHGEFDRKRRDWQAILKDANQNPNTKGSTPVGKLYDIIDELTDRDQYFESIEADWKSSQTLSSAQYDDIVSFCTQAFTLLKEGCKVVGAISACMRL